MGIQQCPRHAYDLHVQRLRCTEYPSLLGTTYLDHAGTTLYPSSLIDAYHQDLKSNLYGNPHSECPASNLSTQRVDSARIAVLSYFNADPEFFDVVFTANATAAIKLVADCFRDQSFWYGFHKDAHSSVVGVREVANLGSQCFASNESVETWIEERQSSPQASSLALFAYPAQSNMTGHRLPLSWASRIRNSDSRGNEQSQRTYVLLDAASYLTTGRLDLSRHEAAPDFTALSFYKIFGFPDLGALIVRKTAYEVLTHRRYFGGGTVDQVTVIDGSFHATKVGTIHDFLEDGTLPFHNILALLHAIPNHERLYGSAQAISDHTSYLSAWLYQKLIALKHFNHTSVVQVHKEPLASYGDPITQGPIISFSLRHSNGKIIGKSHFERLAIDCGFQIRTGGVCNPGGIASMLELNHWELRRNFTEGARCGGDIDVVGGKPTGIIRVSLGAMSTMSDVMRFAQFVEWFFVESTVIEPCSPSLRELVEKSKSASFISSIAPIERCSAINMSTSEMFTAYQIWHGQWCIVESRNGNWQLLDPTYTLDLLSCNLDPARGILRICLEGCEDLVVSLWDRPEQITASMTALEARAFDVYHDQRLADWLSKALGLPCTLARYRGEEVDSFAEVRTCPISTCNIEFPDRKLLHQHYKSHAQAFLMTHSLDHKRCEEIDQPPSKRTTLFSRRSWGKSQESQNTIVVAVSEYSVSSQSTELGKHKRTKWQRFRSKMQRLLLTCGDSEPGREKV